MKRSFRFRLALLSALLGGLALAAFGLGAWWQIRTMKLERLGSDVRAQAERESNRRRDAEGWQRTEASIAAEIGLTDSNSLLLLVEDADGKTVYRSSQWPADFDTGGLNWPKRPNGKRNAPPKPETETAPQDKNPVPPPPRLSRPREGSADPPPLEPAAKAGPPGPRPASVTISERIGGHRWRIGLANSENARIAVAVDQKSINAEMSGVRNAFLIAAPLALLLIGASASIFSARALRPVNNLTETARRVTATGLDQRIPVEGEDREFVELVQVFNGMLERLERSFKQAYRFSADAAHELKTPLAILQGQLEKAIHAAGDGSPMQAELTGILDEVRRLSTISRKLLLLAQADAGRLNLYLEPFDLSKVLTELVEDTRMLAPQLQITSKIDAGLITPADGALLRQVLHNLISNAIKYNEEQGWINFSAAAVRGGVEVEVANSSPGMANLEHDKVFERFYRADSAHGRKIEGVGLGLSVSLEIARAHGGDLTLKKGDGGVVRFSLFLPRSVADPSPNMN